MIKVAGLQRGVACDEGVLAPQLHAGGAGAQARVVGPDGDAVSVLGVIQNPRFCLDVRLLKQTGLEVHVCRAHGVLAVGTQEPAPVGHELADDGDTDQAPDGGDPHEDALPLPSGHGRQ